MSPAIRTVIIGSGISGISQAVRLREELGDRVEITILEKKGSPGGTWRDSVWPESGVDVPIHLYSLSDDPDPNWRYLFAWQPEVLAYWERQIDKHDLRSVFSFNSEYIGSKWDADKQVHKITFKTGTYSQVDIEAEVLISATGPLAKRKFPNVPGKESFQGPWFHNLDWDASVDMTGKRVAVIGNGSSGVQVVPGLAKLPGTQVTHYARSGSYYVPKNQREYSALEKFAFNWLPGYLQLYRFVIFLQHDNPWSIKSRLDDPKRQRAEKDLLAYLRAKAPAKYLDALTPKFPLGTKRPPLDYGWLDSLHRDNVELVSSNLAEVTATGITTADGTHRAHDVIIYATGSDVATHGLGANVNLFGENDLELEKYWASIGGPQSYAGIAVPQFPNYFIIIGPNSVAGSWYFTISRETIAIARIVREIVDYGLSSVQPKYDVFVARSEATKKSLETGTVAEAGIANYWKASNGRITVNSSWSGVGLWWNTLATRWSDWDAVRQVRAAGDKYSTRLEKVDVARLKRRAHMVRVLLLIVLGAALHKSWPCLRRLAHGILLQARP